jgi:hypothetical protein
MLVAPTARQWWLLKLQLQYRAPQAVQQELPHGICRSRPLTELQGGCWTMCVPGNRADQHLLSRSRTHTGRVYSEGSLPSDSALANSRRAKAAPPRVGKDMARAAHHRPLTTHTHRRPPLTIPAPAEWGWVASARLLPVGRAAGIREAKGGDGQWVSGRGRQEPDRYVACPDARICVSAPPSISRPSVTARGCLFWLLPTSHTYTMCSVIHATTYCHRSSPLTGHVVCTHVRTTDRHTCTHTHTHTHTER